MIANFAHELHPEDYYMQNPDTDEWDVEVELETGYPAGTAVLWRRAKWITQPYVPGPDPDDPVTGETPEQSVSGYQYIQASPDTIAVYTGEFTYTVTAIYQQWVHAEVWNETFQYWERPQPTAKYSQAIYDPDDPERLLGVEYTADFSDGSQLKTIINYNWFTGNVNKHTYRFYGPGLRKRIYTQLQIYDPNRFNMDLSDFDGPYEVIEQAGLTNVIYYPDGVTEDECLVDPYLGVDEQSSYIDVAMDGIVAQVHFARNDGSSDWIEFFEGATERVKSRSNIRESGNSWTLASYNTATVLENGPNRVVIRIDGNFMRTNQNSNIPGSTSIECYLYIYNDIIFYDLIWAVNTAITVQDSDFSSLLGMHQNSVSSPKAIYEEAGSELFIFGANDADMPGSYVGLISDEINGPVTLISDTTGVVTQRRQPKNTQGGSVCINDKTVPAGNHRIVAAMIVDAQDRLNDGGTFNAWSAGTTYAKDEIVIDSNEIRWISRQDGNIGNTPPATGGSSAWWLEYRIHFGIQYNDFLLTNLEDIVNDLNIPISVGAGGFASDGAFHSEPRAADGKSVLTYDIDRIKPKHVLHNFPLQYGDVASPTNLLLAYWKLDDNAPNTDILEASGDANWTGTSSDPTSSFRRTNAVRGTALGFSRSTGNNLEFPLYNVSGYKNKITVIVDMYWDFLYNTSSNQSLVYLFEGSSSRIGLYYRNSNDRLTLYNNLGGVADNITVVNLSSNELFRKWLTIQFIIDLDNARAKAIIDSVDYGWKTLDPPAAWSVEPSKLLLGANNDPPSAGGAIICDNLRLFSEIVLPYGSIFTGNGSVDPLVAHADVTMHSVDGITADIGGDITDISNIDDQIGSVSLWCDAVSGDVWSAGTQNFKVLYNGSAFEFQYGGILPRSVISQDVSGPDHYVRAGWDFVADIMYIEVDGIRNQTDSLQAITLAGSITWSGSVNRRRLFITNNLFTPENWTSNENPLHLPLVDAL